MIRYLAESADYKVYALDERVFVRRKASLPWQDEYDPADRYITSHYGNPTAALITSGGHHIIVSGCGLTIYDVLRDNVTELSEESHRLGWTSALHHDQQDDGRLYFRFISYNDANQLRVFRMNLVTQLIEELD